MNAKATIVAAVVMLSCCEKSLAVLTIYRDDFNYTHNFFAIDPIVGIVPGFNANATSGGGIWGGMYNSNNGVLSANVGLSQAGTFTMPLQGGQGGQPNNRGWEGNVDTGTFLYRLVDLSDFVSVRARIASQPQGN